jgi:hypothetical protein
MIDKKEKKVGAHYEAAAKEIVDLLFDKGFFRKDLSRDGMNTVEHFLAWLMQNQADMAVRCAMLVKRVEGEE